MTRTSMRSFRINKIDDDRPLTEEEWPSTTTHNRKIFEEIRPNTRMMQKIYMVLYYERTKLDDDDPHKILNVYDIPITPQILRRIIFNTEQTQRFEKARKKAMNEVYQRKKYKTISLKEYQKKIDQDVKERLCEEYKETKTYKKKRNYKRLRS